MTIEYLTLEDLLALAEDLNTPGIRDLGLLDSASHRPQSSLMGREAYPTLHEKASVLLESIVRNHPLVDGNKRLGWLAVYVFYKLNGIDLDAPEDEAYDLVIGVTTGTISYAQVAKQFSVWTRPADSDL